MHNALMLSGKPVGCHDTVAALSMETKLQRKMLSKLKAGWVTIQGENVPDGLLKGTSGVAW